MVVMRGAGRKEEPHLFTLASHVLAILFFALLAYVLR